jgi:hypothetical protein
MRLARHPVGRDEPVAAAAPTACRSRPPSCSRRCPLDDVSRQDLECDGRRNHYEYSRVRTRGNGRAPGRGGGFGSCGQVSSGFRSLMPHPSPIRFVTSGAKPVWRRSSDSVA